MDNSNPSIWEEEYVVRTREVDASGRLKLSALADYFQEAAAHHTTARQIGPYQLKKYHLAWVLSRLRIDIERYPGWGEKLLVTTWPKGEATLSAPRDFLLTDESGQPVANATSLWLLIDTDAMRPRPLSALPVDFPVDLSRVPALPEPPGKIAVPPVITTIRRRTPDPCDIDLNGHLNNACYLDWVSDCLPAEQTPPRRVEINYLSEIKISDIIVMASGASPNGLVFQGTSEQSGHPAFRSRIL